jgi:AcrR family transcriptional regulator
MATSRKVMGRAPRRSPASGLEAGAAPAPPLDERQQREERILDAAAELLVRWGYRKTTIDDVAHEAGVGKGTIYLHWKDKNALFNAAIWRASQQATDDTLRRIAADPEGGQFHRVWTHGMLAVLSNRLTAALMTGNPDIFQGIMETLPPATLDKLEGNAEENITQLQRAGLIRADVPVADATFLMGALKIGIIHLAAIAGPERMPSAERLTEAISDLMRRWLEPAAPSDSGDKGKQIMADWLANANRIASQQES